MISKQKWQLDRVPSPQIISNYEICLHLSKMDKKQGVMIRISRKSVFKMCMCFDSEGDSVPNHVLK